MILYSLFNRMALLTYKHKTHVLDNDRRIVSNADVDFYVDNVMFSFQLSLHWLFYNVDSVIIWIFAGCCSNCRQQG